jgi:hypothetical protein
MFGEIPEQAVAVTLYTDAYVVHGTVLTRHRRVSDILNTAPEAFIVLSDVTMDEWGSTASPVRADYAQVNLGSILFAVADAPVEPIPELRLIKIPEQAFISIPPFRIVGTIHLPQEQNLRLALGELVGRFLPVTEATFWSDTVGEAKQSVVMVAVNHARAQILAPHTDVDPWAGLDRSTGLPHATPTAAAAEVPRAAPHRTVPDAEDATPPGGWFGGAPGSGAVPVAPSRTGLLGRVRGVNDSIDLPRPSDDPGTSRSGQG